MDSLIELYKLASSVELLAFSVPDKSRELSLMATASQKTRMLLYSMVMAFTDKDCLPPVGNAEDATIAELDVFSLKLAEGLSAHMYSLPSLSKKYGRIGFGALSCAEEAVLWLAEHKRKAATIAETAQEAVTETPVETGTLGLAVSLSESTPGYGPPLTETPAVTEPVMEAEVKKDIEDTTEQKDETVAAPLPADQEPQPIEVQPAQQVTEVPPTKQAASKAASTKKAAS